MADNAATNYKWNADNVFKSWDLNPLAQEIGAGADGVRDTLAANRDAFLQPYMARYRQTVGAGNSADDDQGLFNDEDFQNYVRTGQTAKGYKVDDTPPPTPSLPQTQNPMASWTGATTATTTPTAAPPASNPAADLQNQLLQQMFAQQQQQMADNAARNTNLYNILLSRAQQGTQIDGTDPNIRQQADAYSANAQRASRNYLSDLAEKAGPYANLRGEQRLQAERLGQATGSFEAQLIGNELMARRQEIQNALSQMGSMLSVDQQNALQRQLGILDNAIAQQSLGNNLLSTLLGNQLGWANLNSNNDQFAAQLGFNTADRASYWDALRRGLI